MLYDTRKIKNDMKKKITRFNENDSHSLYHLN